MPGNSVRAFVSIRGLRPLLWHAFTIDSLPLERRERKGVAGNDPSEWERTVLADPYTRQLYLPGAYFYSCMREASKFTKKGKASLLTPVSATLQIAEELVFLPDRFLPEKPLTDPAQPVYLDVRGVRNPTTKGLNIRYRIACSPGWTCGFNLLYDRTVVSTEIMQAILNDAGNLVGVGNGRNIGMGRFVIESFTEEVIN